MTERRFLLTGGSSGIGRAVAEMLVQRGDRVVVVTRSADRVADLVGVEVLEADLSDPRAAEELVVPDELDGLIHSAGVVELAPVAETSYASVREQLDVNLISPMLLTRQCLPALRARHGTVVFVNSTSGLAAYPTWSAYSASKAGLQFVADALRGEEPEIRVSTVFPSRTATPMQARVHEFEGTPYDATQFMSAATVAKAIVDVLDLPADAVVTDVTIRSTGRQGH